MINMPSPCDVIFVNPSADWKLDIDKNKSIRLQEDIPNQETPHIGIAYLLSVAKNYGIQAKYIDMVADCISPEELIKIIGICTPILLGFTCFTVQMNTVGKLSKLIKSQYPKIKICVGGPHVSAIPEETLNDFNEIDYLILGEGELSFVNLIQNIDNNSALTSIKGIGTRFNKIFSWDPIQELDAIPFPSWDQFELKKYGGTYPHRTSLELPMVTSRGCPFKCTFCCRSMGDRVRRRSVESVIAEIENNIETHRCESIAFLDETFINDNKWFCGFYNAMKLRGFNKKISWSCSTRVSNISEDLIYMMKDAGCYYIFFGLESANDETLRKIKKGITVNQMRNAIKLTKQYKIIPVGAFIIGLPGDTEKHVLQAIELGKELDLYSITFPIAVPFPGTALREQAINGSDGMKILSNNWDHYGKQKPGVMESSALSWNKRVELQKFAYSVFPKQNIEDYIKRQWG